MLCFCLFCTQAYCKTEWKAEHPVIAACLVQLHKNGLQLKNLNSITTQLWEGSSWHAMCQEATLLWTSWRRLAPRQWHPGSGTQALTHPSAGQNTGWPMNETVTLWTRWILSYGKTYININATWWSIENLTASLKKQPLSSASEERTKTCYQGQQCGIWLAYLCTKAWITHWVVFAFQ